MLPASPHSAALYMEIYLACKVAVISVGHTRFYHKFTAMLIIFIKTAFIFKNPIDITILFCIMRLSVCLVLVNFEFIITEYPFRE